MWKITDAQGRETTLDELRMDYPELVCFSESSGMVYSPKHYMRIYSSGSLYFWENEEESLNIEGSYLATADWED